MAFFSAQAASMWVLSQRRMEQVDDAQPCGHFVFVCGPIPRLVVPIFLRRDAFGSQLDHAV